MWGGLALLTHLLTLRSFGVPYLAPMSPLSPRALLQDDWTRAPWRALRQRPERIARDRWRQPPGRARGPRRVRVKKPPERP